MIHFITSYIVVEIAVILLAVFSTLIVRNRRRQSSGRIPPGFNPTEEYFVDPTTGVKQRVWFNPTTGERHYERLSSDADR